MLRTNLPPGKYFIGDICYLFPRPTEMWDDIVDLIYEKDDQGKSFDFTYKGIRFVGGTTKNGDGEYKDTNGFSYPVDAGIIAIVPYEAFNLEPKNYHHDKLTIEDACINLVEFKNNFPVIIDDGEFDFGHININTKSMYPDEVEWSWD
jgi:hypothetical protein